MSACGFSYLDSPGSDSSFHELQGKGNVNEDSLTNEDLGAQAKVTIISL